MFARRCRSRQYRRSRSTEAMAVTSGSTALSRATRSSSFPLPSSARIVRTRSSPSISTAVAGFVSSHASYGAKQRADRSPPVVRKRFRAAQDRQDDLRREPPHRAGVHGVQPLRQGQRFPGRRHRERKSRHRLRVPSQHRRGQILIVGFRGTEQRRRPAVVRRQPASLEIILDLGLQRAEEFVPQRRLGPERMGLRLPDRLPPVRDRPRLRVEPLDRLAPHPRLAAAVALPAQAPDDVLDHRGQRGVLRGLRRHDPVSVEPRMGEDPRRVAYIVEGDLRRLGLPEDREHQLRPPQHRLPLVAPVVDGRERQAVLSMNEMIRVLQDLPRPLDGGENLGRPDVAVRVGVDEREALRVELDPGYRTGECHPELLVQRLQRRKVGARLEEDLVESSRTEEPPPVIRRFRIHRPGIGCHGLAPLNPGDFKRTFRMPATTVGFTPASLLPEEYQISAGNQCRVRLQNEQTESMTGTSTRTPTTVASAAPDPGP